MHRAFVCKFTVRVRIDDKVRWQKVRPGKESGVGRILDMSTAIFIACICNEGICLSFIKMWAFEKASVMNRPEKVTFQSRKECGSRDRVVVKLSDWFGRVLEGEGT